MKPLGGITAFEQPVDELVRSHLGTAEDDAVELGGNVYDPRQCVELVRLAHLEIDLVGQVGRKLRRLHPQHLHLVHVGARKVHDALRHGRREEQHAPPVGRMRHDLLDIVDKSHVQHLVGLVENEVADAGEVECPAPDMVEYASRGPHHDVGPLREPPELFTHGGTAVDGCDGESFLPVIGDQLLGHLQGEFPRGNQHDGLHSAGSAHEVLQNGQSVCGRLARSRLGLGDDVVLAVK